MRAEVGMKYFLVISNLETEEVESSRLKRGSESYDRICFEKVGPGLGEGREGISDMHCDVKSGEKTHVAGWQRAVEPGAFGDKSSGMNDKPLALRQRELSGVIFGLLGVISGNHTGA